MPVRELYSLMDWFKKHRFYLSEEAAARINASPVGLRHAASQPLDQGAEPGHHLITLRGTPFLQERAFQLLQVRWR